MVDKTKVVDAFVGNRNAQLNYATREKKGLNLDAEETEMGNLR